MMVVLVAWTCDVGLSAALNAKRFDLGFYAGRAYGLMAASFVLIMLILETRALYTRLARTLSVDKAAAEDRADTARRTSHETAETLRAVIDSSSLGVLALSPAGDVLLWNRTAERLFGYVSREVIGRPYPLLPHDRNARQKQRTLFTRALAGATSGVLDIRCRRRDGKEMTMRGSAAPFFDASGAPRGIAITLEDLSEKNATEEMLRQAQKMEAVGQLTGGLAHDFNNILMVILANVEEMQEDESLPANHRARLARIAASGEHAADLTRRLLAFARKQHLQPQATNLNDLVAGIDKLLRRTLGGQIEFDIVLVPNLRSANVDRAQVEAALPNLCINARDAMPGGGKLLIETTNVDLDHDYAQPNSGVVPGQYVMVAVGDTGTGIPPELLPKVFDPFFTTKETGKGTGLGLSMVYGFIKQSNGHIKIYSEVGIGTTVRIYLPSSDAEATGHAPGSGAVPPRGFERILLVEDDPQVREAVLVQLRSLGYAVTDVGDAHRALECLDRDSFDVVLSDVVMPGMSGLALAKAVASLNPSTRVLLMSGYSEHAAHLRDSLEAGAPLLSKPFRKIDLAVRIREVLDGKRGEDGRIPG